MALGNEPPGFSVYKIPEEVVKNLLTLPLFVSKNLIKVAMYSGKAISMCLDTTSLLGRLSLNNWGSDSHLPLVCVWILQAIQSIGGISTL